MNPVYQYFIRNFFLICLTFGVIFMVLRSYRAKKVRVLMPICIVLAALSISIAYAVEAYTVTHPQLIFLGTFCFFYGFAVRPLIIYFFLRMTTDKPIVMKIALGLVIANAAVYAITLCRFAPDFAKTVYWYDEADGVLIHTRGPLYYFSYGVVGIMAAYLVFASLSQLKGRRRYDALASLIAFAFIVAAVLLETFDTSLVDYSLLNTTIAIACLFYVVHLYQQAANRDGLTNLFDRKTYYADIVKLAPKVTGVILVDMNSLKQLNDTQGHFAGDVAIVTIARTLEKCTNQANMYVYRMGGDEFLVISTSTKKEALEDAAKAILDEMGKTPYSISLGYQPRSTPETTITDMMKVAETEMYEMKAEYHRKNGRRVGDRHAEEPQEEPAQ